ncbi:hypothetical protein DID75_03650 [Candidatus Marinamargulisbacteria bacterium SCGC AG-410-N11]|nr:hypothetical protein DID75_03650 [Candidatus Marinamargulisbacteria bacterium SCGC AG-410-N11]
MKLNIKHITKYTYTAPVFLNVHQLKLMPKSNYHQHAHSFKLNVKPRPIKNHVYQCIDESVVHQLFFNTKSTFLTIESESQVETFDYNPYDYWIYPLQAIKIPFEYEPSELLLLEPYLNPISIDHNVKIFVKETLEKTNHETIHFLMLLTKRLQKEFKSEYRVDGAPLLPKVTLSRRAGTCRDKALFAIAACRMVGLATRFVSGYLYDTNLSNIQHELHAWFEVFIPGGGWKGFDPTYGIATNHYYIDVCSFPSYELCYPLKGSFSGDAESSLSTNVTISPIDQFKLSAETV